MARKGGAPENLKPVRSKDEAKLRGKNGGVKSGEVRRKKREAKDAARLILNLPCGTAQSLNLKNMGVSEEDYTNRVALFARAFVVAMTGDINAMKFLIESAAENPHFMLEQARFNHEKGMQEKSNNAVDDWVQAVIEADEQERLNAEQGKD